MMTLKKAESIIGFGVDVIPVTVFQEGLQKMHGASCNWEYGTVVVTDPDRRVVLQKLVDEIYRLRGAKVRQLSGYRCQHCGRLGPTEIDHIKPRSKGRDDRMENLRAVCPSFTGCGVHQKKHG